MRVLPVIFLAATALLPLRAHAHAVLVDSNPAIGGSIAAGQTAIALHYNSRIDRGRSVAILTQPDHNQVKLEIRRDGPEDTLDSSAALTAPGAYNIRWQVLAVDGHITRGDVPFTVIAPAAGAATGH